MEVYYLRYCYYSMESVDGRLRFTYGIEEVEAPPLDPAPASEENPSL
jgi:hypothetical protein